MSMDKSAIVQIQEASSIPAVIEQVKSAGTQVPIAVAPNTMAVSSLEQYMENASRYRLSFKTVSIGDFIQYNKEFDQQGATCFIDAENMSAQTIFDLGTLDKPLHKQNKAKLNLRKTAAFRAITQADGKAVNQKDAANFIEDWAHLITVKNKENETMSTLGAAKSLQDITIETAREIGSKVSDFGESMSAMERVEAKNQNSIPAEITFKCVPYLGFEEIELVVRVGILTGYEKPRIVLRILHIDLIEENITLEFKEKLTDAFEDLALKTFIGEV